MSLAALELDDAGVMLGDGRAPAAVSPAYAILEPGTTLLGEAARARARLAPRQTHTRFWQRLGTEPLHAAPPQVRHHADLAFLHLQQLHALAGAPAELILAVPGSFSREQLAILLGIAEGSAFRAVGLVDSALAAATCAPGDPRPLLHLELQLHQCVLTRIDREDGQLVRHEVRALPGTGLIELQERWARRAAAAFIQQTRFDPLHDAIAEQQLYDGLGGWIARLATEDDTGAELASGARRHLARLRAADMLDAVQPLYAEVLDAVARDGDGRHILLGARIAALPRFAARLPGAAVLAADAVLRGALAHAALIRSEDRALRFVTRLPAPALAAAEPVVHAAPAPREFAPPSPTHLLAGDHALRLAHGVQHLYRDPHGAWRLSAATPATPACRLQYDAQGWSAQALGGATLRIDGEPVSGPALLGTGSRIALDAGPELRLIAEIAPSDDAA